MALILQHLTVKSFWADHWSAVRSSDDNIRDDGGNLVNHGRRFVGLLPFFCVTDFLPPLLSPQKNGIIGITNIFKEAGQMGIYVNPDNADFRRCLKKTMLSNEVKVDLIEFYQRNKKQINRKL